MLWRRRREQELNDEIASHLAMARSDGRPPSEFGNVTLVREITREMWGWGSLDRLLQDIRYGLRTMRRAPAFTAVAVLSLALGIGANTAIFSLIDTLMLRSLPVREPDQLVELLTRFNAKSRFNAFSWPTYRHLRDDTPPARRARRIRRRPLLYSSRWPRPGTRRRPVHQRQLLSDARYPGRPRPPDRA